MARRLERTDLASLAGDKGEITRGVPGLEEENQKRTTARVSEIAPNPSNPRHDVGDVSELASSLQTVGQLQPCTVVTRQAYLDQRPEHAEQVGTVSYVAITGARRLAAAAVAGLTMVAIVVRNELATSPEQLITAALAENVEREDLNPFEEAEAVAKLVHMCGSQRNAAQQLRRTQGWVSQRQTLLRLPEEQRQRLVAGEITVVQALDLARSSPSGGDKGVITSSGTGRAVEEPRDRAYRERREVDRFARSVRRISVDKTGSRVDIAAAALRQALPPEEWKELAAALTK